MGMRAGFGFLIRGADVRAEFARCFRIYPPDERQKIDQCRTVGLGVEDVSQTVYDFGVRGGVLFVDETADIGFHHWAGNGIGGAICTIRQLTKDSDERNGIGFDESDPALLNFLGIIF